MAAINAASTPWASVFTTLAGAVKATARNLCVRCALPSTVTSKIRRDNRWSSGNIRRIKLPGRRHPANLRNLWLIDPYLSKVSRRRQSLIATTQAFPEMTSAYALIDPGNGSLYPATSTVKETIAGAKPVVVHPGRAAGKEYFSAMGWGSRGRWCVTSSARHRHTSYSACSRTRVATLRRWWVRSTLSGYVSTDASEA